MKLPRLALLAAALSARVAAAEPDAVVPLPKVVVTGTPIIQENGLTPLAGQFTVVTQEQITDLNAQDLQSALRETPGVVVTHYDPVGSFGGGEGGAVFIRGMGASRPGAEIQLAIDGIANFNSLWTHPLLDMLSVDIAQRIDVYKGAQPVLYGNMAFGVVDVTTKRQTDPGFTTSLQTAYGSYNTFVEVAEQGGKVGDFDYYLLQSFRSSDGNRPHSAGELQNLFGRLGYTLNPNWEAHAVFNRTNNWADDPGPSPSLVPPSQAYNNGRFNDDDDLAVATLANHYAGANGYVKAYWNRGTLNWVNQYDTTTRSNDENTLTNYDNYGIKTRETFKPWTGGEVMSGVDVDFIRGKYNELLAGAPIVFPDETWRIFSPYASLSQRWNLDSNVYLQPSAGFRYFDHSVFSSEFAPQAGLVFGVRETELHASYARGVNYPGIFVDAFPPGNNLGHGLNPETLDHFELGAGQRFGRLAKLDVTLFYDGGHDRVVLTYPPYPPVWKNISNFHTAGLETTLTITPADNVALFGGFTVLNSNPSDLPYAPQLSASAGVTYRFSQRFHLSIDGQYVGTEKALTRARDINAVNASQISSFLLVNAKLSRDFAFPSWRLHGQIFVSGQNLTNAHYQQQPGYPMPGFNGMAGIRVSF
jgi:iron complex outermembrane receptor protein